MAVADDYIGNINDLICVYSSRPTISFLPVMYQDIQIPYRRYSGKSNTFGLAFVSWRCKNFLPKYSLHTHHMRSTVKWLFDNTSIWSVTTWSQLPQLHLLVYVHSSPTPLWAPHSCVLCENIFTVKCCCVGDTAVWYTYIHFFNCLKLDNWLLTNRFYRDSESEKYGNSVISMPNRTEVEKQFG